jgi:hypothetical protein
MSRSIDISTIFLPFPGAMARILSHLVSNLAKSDSFFLFGSSSQYISLEYLGVAVNDPKDVRTCNFGGKFLSRNDFFLEKL